MSTENLGFVIFEDEANTRKLFGFALQALGHSVITEATDRDEAIRVINDLKPREVQVALIDGNLSHERKDGSDGAWICTMLREKFNDEVILIGVSGTGKVVGAHHNIEDKSDFNLILEKIEEFTTPSELDDTSA